MFYRLDFERVEEVKIILPVILKTLEKIEKKISEGWHITNSDVIGIIDDVFDEYDISDSIDCLNWLWLPELGLYIEAYVGPIEPIDGDGSNDEVVWMTIKKCKDDLCDCRE